MLKLNLILIVSALVFPVSAFAGIALKDTHVELGSLKPGSQLAHTEVMPEKAWNYLQEFIFSSKAERAREFESKAYVLADILQEKAEDLGKEWDLVREAERNGRPLTEKSAKMIRLEKEVDHAAAEFVETRRPKVAISKARGRGRGRYVVTGAVLSAAAISTQVLGGSEAKAADLNLNDVNYIHAVEPTEVGVGVLLSE